MSKRAAPAPKIEQAPAPLDLTDDGLALSHENTQAASHQQRQHPIGLVEFWIQRAWRSDTVQPGEHEPTPRASEDVVPVARGKQASCFGAAAGWAARCLRIFVSHRWNHRRTSTFRR